MQRQRVAVVEREGRRRQQRQLRDRRGGAGHDDLDEIARGPQGGVVRLQREAEERRSLQRRRRESHHRRARLHEQRRVDGGAVEGAERRVRLPREGEGADAAPAAESGVEGELRGPAARQPLRRHQPRHGGGARLHDRRGLRRVARRRRRHLEVAQRGADAYVLRARRALPRRGDLPAAQREHQRRARVALQPEPRAQREVVEPAALGVDASAAAQQIGRGVGEEASAAREAAHAGAVGGGVEAHGERAGLGRRREIGAADRGRRDEWDARRDEHEGCSVSNRNDLKITKGSLISWYPPPGRSQLRLNGKVI